MSVKLITESTLEQQAISWFQDNGYTHIFAPDIAPGEANEERKDYSDIILFDRLKNKLTTLNQNVPPQGIEEALRKIQLFEHQNLIQQNKSCHKYLTDGVDVQYQTVDGTKSDKVWLIDFKNIENNEFCIVNQFTVIENKNHRRPDLVIFINGLPVSVIELKNPVDTDKDIWSAFNQLQTYKNEIGSLFYFNEVLVVSDGLNTRVGSLTSDKERFLFWRTIEGEKLANKNMLSLEVLIKGLFQKSRFLEFIRYFIAFDQKPKSDKIIKIIAGYHQFNAVQTAIQKTIEAIHHDKRIGTIWHSTGSGKSFSMAFFAGKAATQEGLNNPTLIVLTDRNDLDSQLFGQFSRVVDLIRQTPVQIESRKELQEKLVTASGGIYFTTIQKFLPESKGQKFPMLSDRKNIIVIADEAHRSQYDFLDGFAKNMRDALPNASFIGFTGTPIATTDADTRAVFGDYISIYDIERSIADGATVPIYYAGRLIKLERNEEINLDDEIEELTETDEISEKEKVKSKWATLEALTGVESRVKQVASDFVEHFAERLKAMDGKAMIVCMSRRICVDLYNAIINIRPQWHSDEDDKGVIKIVMTGSAADKEELQKHIRSKARREAMADDFKNPDSAFKIVIVRDMWLTGFDVPSMHTMYIDKPMKGHGLMQAISRVNRVFKDKPGGLVVDYLGIADALKKTMGTYTQNGGAGKPTFNKSEAVAVMLEKFEICQNLFHGFSYQRVLGNHVEILKLMPAAQEHILSQDDGKKRFTDAVYQLSRAFALATPDEQALARTNEIIFFQSINGALNKRDPYESLQHEDKEHAIKQLISKSIYSSGVTDIFSAAGLKKPDISILSDEFLSEVKGLPQKNLAIELLEKLISGELKTKMKQNKIKERQFSEMLDNALKNYKNRGIETAKVIEDLIQMAKDIREASKRGEKLGLTAEELIFYDALELNDSAVKVLGDPVLRRIAIDLVQVIKNNLDVDWSVKETSRAKVRMAIKRILKKYGYPPDLQEKAIEQVIQQAEQSLKYDE